MADRYEMTHDEARWLGVVCQVFGFRPVRRASGEVDYATGQPGDWLVSDPDFLYLVLDGRITVGIYWGIDEPTAFWFPPRDGAVTDKDERALAALNRLSGGDFDRLAADWRAYLASGMDRGARMMVRNDTNADA